jgi:hypothetical protein
MSFTIFAGEINDDDQLLKTPDDGGSHNLYLYQASSFSLGTHLNKSRGRFLTTWFAPRDEF